MYIQTVPRKLSLLSLLTVSVVICDMIIVSLQIEESILSVGSHVIKT